jgi:hypothetical protein
MEKIADRPPVRTGKCSLLLIIDGKRYRVSPAPPVSRGSKIWHLKVMPGQERAGRTYSICSFRGKVDCTCPDATKNGAVCKHSRALQALRLVAKTAKPSVMAAWEERQPSRRRKLPVPRLGQTAAAPAAEEKDEAKAPIMMRTRRLHVPAVGLAPSQADPADGFAMGWKNAVQCHVEKMRSEGGLS